MRPTIRDVAKRAGVSVTTVSRVISRRSGEQVRPETRENVLAAIAELNYTPARTAQRLRRGKTGIVAILVPDISNPFFATLARGAEGEAFKTGSSLLICDSNQLAERESRYLRILREERVDGIVLIPTGHKNVRLIEQIKDYGIRVVFADRVLEGFPAVKAENEESSYDLTRYVLEQGYRRPIYLSGPESVSTAMEREAGFLKAIEEFGLSRAEIYHTEFTYNGGYEAVTQVPSLTSADVVMTGNDLMAIGTIRALEARGIRVPEDVAVTGFDCIPWSNYFKPSLTTVRVPALMIGEEAMKLIWAEDAHERISVPCEIVHGETVRRIEEP